MATPLTSSRRTDRQPRPPRGRERTRAARRLPVKDADSRPLSAYRVIVLRHSRALIACLLAGLLGGAAQMWASRDIFNAITVVSVREPSTVVTATTGDGLSDNVTMDTEVQILLSTEVADAAAATLGTRSAVVARRTSVTIPPNSRFLNVRYQAPGRRAAIGGSLAVANAYLKVRRQMYDDQRNRLLAQLSANVSALTTVRKSAEAVIANKAASRPAKGAATRRANAMTSQLSRQQRRIAEVKTIDTTPGTVTKQAKAAWGMRVGDRAVPLASGLALGLVGWVGLLPWLGRRRRVREVAGARRLPGVGMTMSVPSLLSQGRPSAQAAARVALLRWWGQVLVQSRTTPRVIAVLPADRGRAARDLAVDLASTSAVEGVPTVLACLGPPPWVLLQALGLEPPEQPAADDRPAHIIGPTSVPQLCLAMLVRPEAATVEGAIADGVGELGRQFAHIVVLVQATGAVEQGPLSRLATVNVIVAQRGTTRMTDLAAAVLRVRDAGGPPPWVTVLGRRRRRSRGGAAATPAAPPAARRPPATDRH